MGLMQKVSLSQLENGFALHLALCVISAVHNSMAIMPDACSLDLNGTRRLVGGGEERKKKAKSRREDCFVRMIMVLMMSHFQQAAALCYLMSLIYLNDEQRSIWSSAAAETVTDSLLRG